MGMYARVLTGMMSHGSDGLRQVAEDAVLNANYIKARLLPQMTAAFEGPCMHEALYDDRWLDGTGVSTLDFAKAMIDEAFHPMTMYFAYGGPRLRHVDRADRDASLQGRPDLVLRRPGWPWRRRPRPATSNVFTGAPFHAPMRRLDETLAARKPKLRWKPAEPALAAAEKSTRFSPVSVRPICHGPGN